MAHNEISVHVDDDSVTVVVRDDDGTHASNYRVTRFGGAVGVYVSDPAVRVIRESHGNVVEV